MKKAAEFVSMVDGGKLHPTVVASIQRLLKLAEGKRVKITLQLAKKRRSCKQNAYMWGVVIPAVLELFREAGNTITEEGVHDFLKAYVGGLQKTIIKPDGTRAVILGSTTDLGTAEFEQYLEKCRAWAAQFGCLIPLPNEGENQWLEA